MAKKLKCWKKDVDLKDYAKIWLQKKEKGDVVTNNKHNDGWSFNVFPSRGRTIKKERLTEKQALKFAESYMKKHNVCNV